MEKNDDDGYDKVFLSKVTLDWHCSHMNILVTLVFESGCLRLTQPTIKRFDVSSQFLFEVKSCNLE